jgi:hypothetical protein
MRSPKRGEIASSLQIVVRGLTPIKTGTGEIRSWPLKRHGDAEELDREIESNHRSTSKHLGALS